MIFKFNKKIGNMSFQFEDTAETNEDFFKKANFYAELPEVCGNCGSSNLVLRYREPQGFKYSDVSCKNCNFQLNFGHYREIKGGLFPKGWSEYTSPADFAEKQDIEEQEYAKNNPSKKTVTW